MHLNAYYVARVAKQSVLQLSEAQFEIPISVTFIEHHLLCVMSPPFGIGSAANKLSHFCRSFLHPEELHVMARIRFMNSGTDYRAVVEAGHVLFNSLFVPFQLRQCDIKICL